MNMNQKALERLLNDHEVAALVGVSVATVRRWRLTPGGPSYLRIGGLIRYRPESIRQWLDSRQAAGTIDADGQPLIVPLEDSSHA